ncbi:alpha/beta hydrolase-fold protein [Phenylobacterium sp.]|uniref:alpha/beta hydrolase n=1 Tax=Phenylobacterium sp. TaxID=1871053 RepID=UPI0025CE5BA1|nr:alpha/beta hydrolase-fold protein [Phenylobacterium sp.]
MAALLAGATLALGPAAPAGAAAAPPSAAPLTIGLTYRLPSAVLGDVRELNVRLPAGYAPGKRTYPVLYLLDGAADQDFEHIAGLAQLGDVSGTFGPFIVVGVQTRARRAELTPPATDARYRRAFPEAGGAARFRRFLAEEAMPFIAARYGQPSRRAILGESLAGLFVVDTLLRAPDLFDDYVAVSPSLWWDDRAGLRDLGMSLDPRAMAGRRLVLAVADEGGTMQAGIDLLREALGPLTASGFSLTYDDRSATETHATVLHPAALAAFRKLYPAPPADYGPTPWFMIEGGRPTPDGGRR